MTTQTDSNQELSAEIQILSKFIHELNITRRHLLTYPPGHPMIDSAFDKVLSLLGPLFESQQGISLGIAKDALMFEQQWLAKNNPSFRDFASTLTSLDVAAIHFRSKPDKSEILKFAELLNSDRQKVNELGGISELLLQLQLSQIEVTPVDYTAFQATELEPHEQEELAAALWENFLTSVIDESLRPNNVQGKKFADLSATELAAILNRSYVLTDSDSNKLALHDQAIATFVQQLQAVGKFKQAPGEQFQQLIEQLNPELRQQFLNSTFRHASAAPSAEGALQAFPTSMIELAMQEINQNQLQVSSTMVNLIGKLSQHHNVTQGQVTSGAPEENDKISEELKTLFREEDKGKFTPDSYQAALDEIVLREQDFQLDNKETKQLRQQILDSSIERHNCAIIFNLLMNAELRPEHCDGMQDNLIDLAQFFLETGDFKGLGYLHQRLAQYTQQHSEAASERTALLQGILNAPEFHQEIIDNLSRWDEQKQKEINAYIKMAGANIAESLIGRLATEEDKSLRRIYLTTLASLGKASHSAIYAMLNDDRWFLVRNLLTTLRMQDDQIDLDKIEKLEKHPHLRIKQEMLQLLFKFDRTRANRLLTKQLSSDDPQLRLHAIQLAEQSSDPAIAQKLLSLLNAEKLSDDSLPLKKQIVKSLNGIGSEAALPALEKLLKPGFLFTSKRKLELQKEIIRHLDKYPTQKTGPLLQKLIRSRNQQLNSLAAEKLRHQLRKQT